MLSRQTFRILDLVLVTIVYLSGLLNVSLIVKSLWLKNKTPLYVADEWDWKLLTKTGFRCLTRPYFEVLKDVDSPESVQ